MNNPFYYSPSPECLKAVKELTDWLYGKPSPFCSHPVSKEFRDEIDKGKMFGVLCYHLSPNLSSSEKGELTSLDCNHKVQTSKFKVQRYIAAYSGQVCGRSDWQEFVPAVFDYLQPDGYFKQHEAEIVEINKEIALFPSPEKSGISPLDCNHKPQTSNLKPQINKYQLEGESREDYIRRRQFENAELHRWKLRERVRQAEEEAARRQKEDKINSLKTLRRQKSDDLQRWLFRNFVMMNGKGEKKNLLDIFRSIPPAGSGECCEPKLLQYAFTHGLQPVSMAMFWWGESPKNEIRHHLHFYPACNSKCKPILKWMLQGIDVDPNPLESKEQDAELIAKVKTLYEDDDICVISKPAGLLSVPGKSGRDSVLSLMRRRYPTTDSPLIVHRLDMDTSGLMVIAKTLPAYHNLQKQFAEHKIQKRYVAILSKVGASPSPSEKRGGASPSPSKGGDVEMLKSHSISHPSQQYDLEKLPDSSQPYDLERLSDSSQQYDSSICNQHPLLWRGLGRLMPSSLKDLKRLSLPLRPDLDDRPRQVVDFEHGRTAITLYKMVDEQRIWLWPQTGRTHQLRVHCAHRLGLNNPIKGDRLYGNDNADRLYLHAEELTFTHPTTGRKMTFTDKAPF